MDPTILIAAVLGFIAVAGVGFVFAGGNPNQARAVKRAQAIGATPSRSAAGRTARAVANTPEARRKAIVKSLKEQERQAKKAQLTLANKLQQAGLTFGPTTFYIASAVLGVAVMIVAILFHPPFWVAPVLGAAIGAGLPRWVVGFLAASRIKKFTGAFSDAMDIIVRGIKSGLPVHDCLKIIGRETPEPLAGEFRRLMEGIGMGMTFEQALEKMYERMPTPELNFFAIVMNVQQKTGGNLAEALGNLSAVLRARKLMREKIKALSGEATASAAIIGCLPPGVIILVSVVQPTYIQPLFTDPRGNLLLGIGVVVMSLGIWVMRRMINFKF
ncbi:MAG TPA: type II secretion system F family protein [Caulobacteraceae bacterium]|nr:type II secretion system F family protein [Caulobacteraceae bacterium]